VGNQTLGLLGLSMIGVVPPDDETLGVVGRPEDLVGADVVGEHAQAALHRLATCWTEAGGERSETRWPGDIPLLLDLHQLRSLTARPEV
jgi:hypothetical protein